MNIAYRLHNKRMICQKGNIHFLPYFEGVNFLISFNSEIVAANTLRVKVMGGGKWENL